MLNFFRIFLILFLLLPLEAFALCGKTTGVTCPAPDADGDGYTTDGTLLGYDCDDTDWQIYPGVWRYSGGYYSYCQAAGTWSTGTLTPNAATGSGQNYFVDCDQAVNGTGSFASPWNTLKQVSSLAWSTPPSGWHNPVAGDAIWISGQCDELIDRDNVVGGEAYIYFLLYRDGTNSNPIKLISWPGRARAKFVNSGGAVSFISLFEGSDYVELWGIEVSGNGTYGISVAEGSNVKLKNIYAHNVDGEANDNNAGIGFTSVNDSEITNSLFLNNYDVAKCNVVNSINNRNLVLFQGTGNKVKYNYIENTDACTLLSTSYNRGFGYKHGDSVTRTNSSFEFSYNIVKGVDTAFESGEAGSWVHHNYLEYRGMGISAEDVGGATFLNNFIVEYNTGKGAIGINRDENTTTYYYASPLSYVTVANYAALPGTGAADTVYYESENKRRYRWNGSSYEFIYTAYNAFANLGSFPGTGQFGTIYIANDSSVYYKWNGSTYVSAQNIYRYNVFQANEASFSSEKAIVQDSVYGSNYYYDIFSKINHVDYQANCYHNAGVATLVFNHFNAGGGYSNKGSQYFFAGWSAADNVSPNSKPAWDDNSFVENPLFNAIGNATSTNCAGKGYLASLTGGGSPVTSPTPSPTASPSATPVSGKPDFVRRTYWNPWSW